MSDNLNPKQKEAYERIIRGDNLCIMGKGGSGKDSNTRVVSRKTNRGWRKKNPKLYGNAK